MRKIKIPDSWEEVSIGDYQEFVQATSDIERVSIILDEDPEDIRKYDNQTMRTVLNHIIWTKTLPDQNKYNEFVEVDGIEYRLVKNLNGFSLGEWVDIDEYQKDIDTNLHLLFAMLYRPMGEYKSEDVRARGELFRERVQIGKVYGSLLFFSHVAAKSIVCIPRYLIQSGWKKMRLRKKKEKESQRKERQKNGAGITMPTV
jgi:hypothetical protein